MRPLTPFIPPWLDDAGLSLRAFRVLVHLWRRRGGKDEGRCYPSATSIARSCRISRPTVFGALKELEHAGLIVRKRSGARGGNEYFLVAPTSKEIEPSGVDQALKKRYATSQKNDTPLVKNFARKGYSEGIEKEGARAEPARSLSKSDSFVAEVEAMPEFVGRCDIRKIAQICAPIRNAAHLAQRVRDELNPQYTAKPVAIVAEPVGWREWLIQTRPENVYTNPEADTFAPTWAHLPKDTQAWIAHKMAEEAKGRAS
ncbi:MAG: helix-turn-helix domain-containing protein [Candidatus Didemnitutus sp.]|nr:helix-turn-helix domain-containing protein [Candidatus Didemnitutus sp.]